MDNITKENFMEHIQKTYEPYQETNEKVIMNINNFQRSLGYSEFYNMTIRCSNALVQCIRYFKENNIMYYGDSFDNSERLLMIACESYVYKLFGKSQNELNTYLQKVNNISDNLVKSIKYKVIHKFGPQIIKLTKKELNFKDDYKDIQSHVYNYYDIGNQISDFNPENDLYKALEVYLPIMLHNIHSSLSKYYEGEDLYIVKYKYFNAQVLSIVKSLFKLKKFGDIQKTCDLETKLIKDDFEKYKQSLTAKKIKKEIYKM